MSTKEPHAAEARARLDDQGRDPGAGALIGICGVTGAGKTVFLTSVFQTIDTVIPDHGLLTFDRKDVGGANYFENVETRIRETGKAPPTREEIRARLLLKIDDPDSKLRGRLLSIDLLDFAGKYFSSLADLKTLLMDDLPPEEHAAAVRVDEYFERCHGLILLISARLFNEDAGLPAENPFPRSIGYLIEDCRQRKRPLAIVFSQADVNPGLSEEQIFQFPRIQKFRRHFTSDIDEALTGDRPFGIVKLLTCYETGSEGLPKKQSVDGAIWKPDASRVFLAILQAAWPAIRKDLYAAETKRRQAERQRLNAAKQSRRKQAGRRWRLTALVLVAAALLSAFGYFGLQWQRQLETRQQVAEVREVVTRVRHERLPEIGVEQLDRLGDIWDRGSELPGGHSPEVEAAFADLWQALDEASSGFVEEPSLELARARDLERLASFRPLFDAARPPWWTPELSGMLAARGEFIRSWNHGREEALEERVRRLETARQRFRDLGDTRFAEILGEQATSAKIARASAWEQELELIANLSARLRRIRELLDSEELGVDEEFQGIARRLLGRWIITSVLELEENPSTSQALAELTPAVAELDGRSVRFNLVYRALEDFDSVAAYQQLTNQFAPLIPAAEELVQERRFLLESTLSDLFQGVAADSRRELWQELIGALERDYLFETSAEARVEGVWPLSEVLAGSLAGDLTSRGHRFLVETLVSRPIYYRELRALEALIRKRYLRYKTVVAYRELLVRLGELEDLFFVSLPTFSVQTLLDELPTEDVYQEDYLAESQRYFLSQREQLEGVLEALKKFNEEPTDRGKEHVESYLGGLLQHHCTVALERDRGDCAGVV